MRNYNVFFTSDTHFKHRNIITLGKGRPFKSIEEHDQTLIDNWNSVVKPNDLVFHLGDIAMCQDNTQMVDLFNKLNGAKHIIVGNHDRQKILAHSLNKGLIQSMRTYHEYKYEADDGKIYTFIMMHWPILEPNHIFRNKDKKDISVIGLYGHVHDINDYFPIYKQLGFPCINVGVDVSVKIQNTKPFTPINAEDIIEYCNKEFKENA